MKYKPGDKVKIKSLEWYNANKNEKGIIPCGDYNFTKLMTLLCGKIVTIKDFEYDSGYIILEDDMVNAWTDEMIEGLADETEPQEKMVSLEKVEEWLYKNFYESYNLNDYGNYDLDEPYISSFFNTINEMFDDFRKTMEE